MTILNFDDVNRWKYFKAKVRYIHVPKRKSSIYISVAEEYYIGTKVLGRVRRILN